MQIKLKNICGYGFILFLGAAALLALMSFSAAEKPNFSKGLLSGAPASAYEKSFDEELKHREASIQFWNSVGYALFKEGKKGVLIGQDGWLFTDEEFAYGTAAANISANKAYIAKVSQILRQDKVQLVVVALPSKARIYQDKLGSYELPVSWKSQYSDFTDFLSNSHIKHVSLDSDFHANKDNGLFLKTDTHWTPIGARIAAMKTGVMVERAFPYLSWEAENFKSSKSDQISYEGDLMAYTVSGGIADKFGLKQDQLTKWKTELVKISEDSAQSNDDLFGDKILPVALVGTSYSANKLWNFEGFLKEALGTDILNMADEGQGPFQTMQNYLNKEYKGDKPKLVIWEIPERYLIVKAEFMKEE